MHAFTLSIGMPAERYWEENDEDDDDDDDEEEEDVAVDDDEDEIGGVGEKAEEKENGLDENASCVQFNDGDSREIENGLLLVPNASVLILPFLLSLPVTVAVSMSLPNDALPSGCVGVPLDGGACVESPICPSILVGESASVSAECDSRPFAFAFALPRRW